MEMAEMYPVFISDMHADADAFMASLVASGGVKKTGPRDKDFKLTRAGRKGRFLIGGDCFDKVPSTLRLLRVIRRLIDRGGDLQLLAGNHDIRDRYLQGKNALRGIPGSRECRRLLYPPKSWFREFLEGGLKLTLNMDKTHVTHVNHGLNGTQLSDSTMRGER
jgi:hypothetical protein